MSVVEKAALASSNGGASASLHRNLARGLRSLDVIIPALMLSMILCACFLLPMVHELPEPVGGRVRDSNQPLFSPGHFLGTDMNGNDMWSRLLHGGRASLEI